jgi:Ring finger domain
VLSKCGHTFHEDCLSRACATNPRCPNCRVHSSNRLAALLFEGIQKLVALGVTAFYMLRHAGLMAP